jgi:hypothetical protein
MRFQENRAGGSRLDAFRLAMQQLTEPRSTARDGEIGFAVFQDERRRARLPLTDLPADPLTQGLRIKRAAVEQQGVDARATLEKIGEVPRDRAV